MEAQTKQPTEVSSKLIIFFQMNFLYTTFLHRGVLLHTYELMEMLKLMAGLSDPKQQKHKLHHHCKNSTE